MLSEYRAWLASEYELLGNASHHAYSFGQANMAKRAFERLDNEFAGKTVVVLPEATARGALAALDDLEATGRDAPYLGLLRAALRAALPQ